MKKKKFEQFFMGMLRGKELPVINIDDTCQIISK